AARGAGVERHGGHDRRHGLPEKYRRQDHRQKGRLHFGREKESGTAARRSSGFVPEARLRRGCRRNRLRTRASRAPYLLGHRRPVVDREGFRMGVVTGGSAYRGGALSQGHGQNRDRNPLLHHQSQTRCGASEPRHSSALGHREQTALGARCRFWRRPRPQTRRPRRRTSPFSIASTSTCSNKTKPANAESTENASRPVGTMTTYFISSEIKMRLPCTSAQPTCILTPGKQGPHTSVEAFRRMVAVRASEPGFAILRCCRRVASPHWHEQSRG